MTLATPIYVLLVEDSRCDAQLAQLWLQKSTLVGRIDVARTGQEALARLRREPPFQDTPAPQLVLLDINLPDTIGWEWLEELRRDAAVAQIPVIVLTGTLRCEDTQRAEDLGAARCLCKPFDADEFTALVEEVECVVREKCR